MKHRLHLLALLLASIAPLLVDGATVPCNTDCRQACSVGGVSTPMCLRVCEMQRELSCRSQQQTRWDSPTFASNTAPGIRVLNRIDYEPAWHPDGNRLAFVSNRGGYLKVWAASFDATALQPSSELPHPRQLTQGTEEDDAPAWSPDGSSIAYVSTRDGNPEIYVMRADGSEHARLTNHPGVDIHPHWSPDGRSIIWNSSRNSADQSNPDTFELFSMQSDGSGALQLTRGGIRTYASWSPDGRMLVFRKQLEDGNSEIFVSKANGRDEINLTLNPAFDGWPSWSRDSRRIVFAREAPDGKAAKIYVMDVDGSNMRILVNESGRNTNPRWSPRKDIIVYSRRDNGRVALHFTGIFERPPVLRQRLDYAGPQPRSISE